MLVWWCGGHLIVSYVLSIQLTANQLKINPITQVVNLNDTNIKLNCDDEPYESCVWKWQVFNASRWIDITSNLTES